MDIISHLHPLFNEETGQNYLHTLRWKDRPLECPHCQSSDIGPWGKYHRRPGLKRYRCLGCRRTFNDLTQTALAHSKLCLRHWILATNMVVPVLFVSSNLPRTRGTPADRLSVVLVA